MPNQTFINPETLAHQIGTPDLPIILDIRLEEDIATDPVRLPTARVHPWSGSDAVLPRVSGQKTVVVCHRGLKLSQGAAALLRAEGFDAVVLRGGAQGWISAGLPTLPLSSPQETPGRWCMSLCPTADEAVAAWILRRFVDPKTQFLAVEEDQKDAVADRFGAEILPASPSDLATRFSLTTWLALLLTRAHLLTPFLDGACQSNSNPTERFEFAITLVDLLYRAEGPLQ